MVNFLCECVNRTYLLFLNAVILVLSIAIIAYSSYSYNRFADFREGIHDGLQSGGIVVGVFLLVLALLGIFAAVTENKVLLGIYFVFAVLISVALLSLGIALLVYVDDIDKVRKGKTDLKSEVQSGLQDYELAMFNACCAVPYNLTAPTDCGQQGGQGQGQNNGQQTRDQVCVKDRQRFDDMCDRIFEDEDGDLCSALEKINIDDKPLVGDPADGEGGCGNGSAFAFVALVSKFLKLHFVSIGATTVVLGVLMLGGVFATCALFVQEHRVLRKKVIRIEESENPRAEPVRSEKDKEGRAEPELIVG